MDHQEFAIPDRLQHLVLGVWSISIDFEQQSSFEILPDSHIDLVFFAGGPCYMATSTGWQPLPSPFLIGLLEQPVRLQANSRVDCLGLKCYPWTAVEILKLPIDSINHSLFNCPIAQLQSILSTYLQAGAVERAVTHLIQYLLEASQDAAPDQALTKVGQAMHTANGALPIHQVADVAHLTIRTLERRFKQVTGHSVKQMLGLMRFERAYGSLWLHPQTNLASLAHDLGYADQAHLSREFKRFSGTTPAAFARRISTANL